MTPQARMKYYRDMASQYLAEAKKLEESLQPKPLPLNEKMLKLGTQYRLTHGAVIYPETICWVDCRD